ncbi:MAG: cell division protein FtsW [Robiginitomaculum sp.]|nr:MAG: cell division protein FtsW [Robiginitomaculum sp.]
MLGHGINIVTGALRDWWWSVDRVLVFTFCTLIAVGLILSLAASPGAAASNHIADPFYFFFRHSVFAIAGLIVMVAVSLADPVNARRFANVVLIGALLVMIYIIFAGHEAKGAQRWVRIGSFSLQPSEFLKPGLIVTVAWLFSRAKVKGSPTMVLAFLVLLVSIALLMKQPDLGQTVLITASFSAVFFLAGVSWVWIIGLGAVFLAGLYSAYTFFPYISARVQYFLTPSGDGNSQTDRALDALTGGGIFGRGPGEGVIKWILPEAHTDYIFSVAVEEYGTVAALFIISLFGLILYRGLTSALRLTDQSEQLAVAGLSVLIGLQAAINIAVNLHISPPEGMTLPFLSYGGSSLLGMCITAGLLLAFTRRRPGAFE